MTVRITVPLHALPQSIALPDEIELRQQLQTIDMDEEMVLIEYRLAADHNIWFEMGGRPTKSVVFHELVGAGGTNTVHPVRLIQTHAFPSLGAVQIDEMVTDVNGRKRPDLCAVQIE